MKSEGKKRRYPREQRERYEANSRLRLIRAFRLIEETCRREAASLADLAPHLGKLATGFGVRDLTP